MTRRSSGPWLATALALGALAAGCGGGAAPTSTTAGGGGSRSSSHNAGRDRFTCHREFGVAGTSGRTDGARSA